MILAFDPDSHIYKLDGRVVPSVSAIMRAAGLALPPAHVDPVTLERARLRGVAVHAACAHLARHGERDPALDGDNAPYVDAFERFMQESDIDIEAVETPFACAQLGIAGTPDLVGFVQTPSDGALLTVIDVKATAQLGRDVDVQCELYAELIEAQGEYAGPYRIAALHLRPQTLRVPYRLELFDRDAARQVAHAALILWRRAHGEDR